MKSQSSISIRGLRSAAANVVLAALYTGFIFRYWNAFAANPRLSHLLLVVMPSLAFVFALARKDPQQVNHSPWSWLVTTGGTFMSLALVPAGATDILAADAVQTTGLVLQIAALISLNRSFGALPAYRAVKSSGLYRLVRHPLYCAYTIGMIGFAINNPSAYNFAIVGVDTVFQLLRIRYEEGLLLQYPDYAAYAGRTRWRLIPLVW